MGSTILWNIIINPLHLRIHEKFVKKQSFNIMTKTIEITYNFWRICQIVHLDSFFIQSNQEWIDFSSIAIHFLVASNDSLKQFSFAIIELFLFRVSNNGIFKRTTALDLKIPYLTIGDPYNCYE